MSAPPRGLYETLLTEALATDLESLPGQLEAETLALCVADAADRIALHLSRVIERALESVDDKDRVEVGVALSQQLTAEIERKLPKLSLASDALRGPGRVLHSVRTRLPDGRLETLAPPLIPLLDTTLLTNAPGEPRVGNQLLAEIHSADRIDVVMAFVRLSGVRPLLSALRTHCQAGRSLRVLTTTYTGSTEPRESQARTRADSTTGRRYQEHETQGSHVMLFARLRSDERAFWFLGPARYAKHEGELPMAVTWRLLQRLPGDLFARFAAAVA